MCALSTLQCILISDIVIDIFQLSGAAKVKLMSKSLDMFVLQDGPVYVEQATKHILQTCSNLLNANLKSLDEVLWNTKGWLYFIINFLYLLP